MALGIVSDDDFEKERTKAIPNPFTDSSTDSLSGQIDGQISGQIVGQVVELERPGRKDGDVNVPDSLRKIIGETSVLEGRDVALDLASNFGISPSSVSAYKEGATSTATIDETPNKSFIDNSRIRIQKRARRTLFSALKHITEDKLEGAKAIDLAIIAKNMGGIIKVMEPESVTPANGGINTQFVIFSPPTREEREYEVITAREG